MGALDFGSVGGPLDSLPLPLPFPLVPFDPFSLPPSPILALFRVHSLVPLTLSYDGKLWILHAYVRRHVEDE